MVMPGVDAISVACADLIFFTDPNLRSRCFLLFGPTPGIMSNEDRMVVLVRFFL